MREVAVVLSDDMDWAEKHERVPADETVTVILDGAARELDLTAEHAAELRKLLKPWLEAGREPEGSRGPGSRTRGKPDPEVSARKKAVRKWADKHQVRARKGPDRPAYMTTTGKYYYAKWLYEAYDQHRETGGIPGSG